MGMRCLYCKTELALFKRLTGGGEFCSEAHRQLYQEEYNRLAVQRLIQAHAVPEERAPLLPRLETQTSVSLEDPEPVLRPEPLAPEPEPVPHFEYQSANGHAAIHEEPEPPPPAEPEVQAPAEMSSFLLEISEPVAPSTAQLSATLEFFSEARPELPAGTPPVELLTGLQTGSLVRLNNQSEPVDYAVAIREGKVELRPLKLPPPQVDVLLRPDAPLRVDAVSEALPVSFDSATPGAAEPVLESEAVFASSLAVPEELRLDFATTGFETDDPAIQSAVDNLGTTVNLSKLENGILKGEEALQANEPLEQVHPYSAGSGEPGPVTPEPTVLTEPVAVGQVTDAEQETEAVATTGPISEEPVEVAAPSEPVSETREEVIDVPADVTAVAETIAVEPPAAELPAAEPVEAAGDRHEPAQDTPAGDKVPVPVLNAMAVTVYGVLPGTAKPQPVFPPHSLISFGLLKPRVAALPLRPLVTFGPRPDSVEAAPRQAGSKVATTAPEVVATEAGQEPSPSQATAAPAPPASDSKPANSDSKSGKGRAAIRAEIRTAQVRARTKVKGPEAIQGRAADAQAPASENQTEAKALAEPQSAPPPSEAAVSAAATEVKAPVEPNASVESTVPEQTAEKKESKAKAEPPAAAEPKLQPMEAPSKTIAPKRTFDFEPAESTPSSGPLLDGPKLGEVANESFLSRLPALVKIAAGLVVVAGIGTGVYFTTAGASSAKPVAARSVEALVPGPLIGDTGWSNDWGGESAGRKGRQISMYRASQNVADYRFEIQAQIESKALGWVFRAKNPQNYHAAKLEVLKAGLNPTVALVRFSVIDGEESARTQLPLPMPVRVDTLYKVRTEARGEKFGIWVNDQLIQEWTDDRIRVGGVGMYTERGERSSVRNVAVTQMVPKK